MNRLSAALLFMVSTPAMAANELAWSRYLCAGLEGIAEARTPAGTRADCLTINRAWEVEWADKWNQAIGQALHYAAQFEREPGVILLCRQSERECYRDRLLLEEAAKYLIPGERWVIEEVDARGEVGR